MVEDKYGDLPPLKSPTLKDYQNALKAKYKGMGRALPKAGPSLNQALLRIKQSVRDAMNVERNEIIAARENDKKLLKTTEARKEL